LELAGAEDEVARGDLVSEGLPDLGDAEGDLHPVGLLNRSEVDEHGLGRLRPQVYHRGVVLDGPHVCLEHQVEALRFAQPAAAFRTPELSGRRVHGALATVPRSRAPPGKVVLSEAAMASLALYQRV